MQKCNSHWRLKLAHRWPVIGGCLPEATQARALVRTHWNIFPPTRKTNAYTGTYLHTHAHTPRRPSKQPTHSGAEHTHLGPNPAKWRSLGWSVALKTFFEEEKYVCGRRTGPFSSSQATPSLGLSGAGSQVSVTLRLPDSPHPCVLWSLRLFTVPD